jgi:uncharacterized phage-associated protein
VKIATPPNDIKMRELILHIAQQSESDGKFGAVKLNKILFYADFISFLRRGKSITGLEYFALSEGPAPRQMLPIINSMKKNGDIAIQKINIGLPNPKSKIIALRDPDYTKLEAADIVIVDEIIKRFWNKTGTDLTKISHEFSGWLDAFYNGGEKTTIPYSAAKFDISGFEFLGVENFQLSGKMIEHGRQIAKKFSKPALACA